MDDEDSTEHGPLPALSVLEAHLGRVGRLGLAGRAAFYLLLVGLTIRLAVLGGAGTASSGQGQADASGALDAIGSSALGEALIAACALGFFVFGVARLVGAARDRRVGSRKQVMTVAQGLFYLVLSGVPIAFLAGAHQTGSQESQQRTVGTILHQPAGSIVLVVAGLVSIVVCVHQIRVALTRQFQDGLDLSGARPAVRRICEVAGVVGIAARSCVFLPVGAFLIVAAVRSDPANAYGTDLELVRLAGSVWGGAALMVVAVGLAAFALFSALECRYRMIVCAR